MPSLAWGRWYAPTTRRLHLKVDTDSALLEQGYQMARNLQSKLAPTDTIRVYDINKAAAERLVQEMKTQQAGGASAQVARNAGDAARDAVCAILPPSLPWILFLGFYDEFVSSMTVLS